MTENETKLINRIRESDDPTAALLIAVDVITSYLQQRQSFEAQAPADLRELA